MDTFASQTCSIGVLANVHAHRGESYSAERRSILSLAEGERALQAISEWPGYRPTPLRSLAGFARRVNIGAILYKDESSRFGLGSFKALGGAYAVQRLLQKKLAQHVASHDISTAELFSGKYRDLAAQITVCCATDGNHGRSVAWGARTFGCNCVVFLHSGVSFAREQAIAAYGARIVRTQGNYDDSVRAANEAAATQAWYLIADTSYPGYMDVPRDVMQGYSVMWFEAERQWPRHTQLTHVFAQGGVGGLAASACAHFWERLGPARPQFIVVEPEAAPCLYESARAGEPTAIKGQLDTVLAGLACGEVSLLAWDILNRGADFFVTIEDEPALDTMRLLASGIDDSPLVVGESGAAALAGLLAMAQDPELMLRLGLDSTACVLVVGTEGDTDPQFYERIVGRTAAEVRGPSL